MKQRPFIALLTYVGGMGLALYLGAQWSGSAASALNGLRPATPFSPRNEAQLIRERVFMPIFPPEWVSGTQSDDIAYDLAWIEFESLARTGLALAGVLAAICIVRVRLSRNGKPLRHQPPEPTPRGAAHR
jgi:hypothetical protein